MYTVWPTSALEFWKLSELVAGDHQDRRTLLFRGPRVLEAVRAGGRRPPRQKDTAVQGA
eukprot:gene10520-7488_t